MGDTVTAFVVITPPGKMHITGPEKVCMGDYIVLTAEGAQNVLWNTGAKGSRIVVQALHDFTYIATGWDGRCFHDTASLTVKVLPKPIADFNYISKDPSVQDTVLFNYTGKGAKLLTWTIDDTVQQGNPKNVQWTFHTPGPKEVKLVVGNEIGCYDSITYKIYVHQEAKIFVPNAFSPNGDDVNDVFKVASYGLKSIHMQIYNRWGERVKEISNLDEGWDGIFKGVEAPEGEYIYTIEAQDVENHWHYLHGGFYILR
jgi:gliding motility-associated-like protein